MLVARLHGPGDLRCETAPDPGPPGPGQVLIAVEAVGLCGSDLHYYEHGNIGDKALDAPLILGHEPAGRVLAVGDGVVDLQPGDLVALDPALSCGRCEPCLQGHPNLCPEVHFFGTPPIDGAFRSRLIHPAEACFKLPPGVTVEEGALCELLGVALHTVDLACLRVGETVTVLGAGPVGLLTVAMARLAGAAEVLVIEPLVHRRAAAVAWGASVAVPPEDEPALLTATAGRGVDVAIDCATSVSTPAAACRLARLGGRAVLCGIPPEDTFCLSHAVARRRGLTLRFVRRMKHVYPRALGLVAAGAVRPSQLVSHRFDLADAATAFATAASRAEGVLKVVLTNDG